MVERVHLTFETFLPLSTSDDTGVGVPDLVKDRVSILKFKQWLTYWFTCFLTYSRTLIIVVLNFPNYHLCSGLTLVWNKVNVKRHILCIKLFDVDWVNSLRKIKKSWSWMSTFISPVSFLEKFMRAPVY